MSFLLFKYRMLLHQRKKQQFLSRHISHHRGAGENLENTMELICWKWTAIITKDVQVVVSHDANLKRSAGIIVNVSDLKYCGLPAYHFREHASVKEKVTAFHCWKRFEAFPEAPINIDIHVNNSVLRRPQNW